MMSVRESKMTDVQVKDICGKVIQMDARVYAGCLSTAMVDFFSYENRVPYGRLRIPYYEHEFFFYGLDQLILTMDDVMESVNSPQADMKLRHIVNEDYQFQVLDQPQTVLMTELPKEKRKLRRMGQLFVIHVFYRQQGSMQGELVVADKKVYFRSVLELMRMIHELLDAQSNYQN